MEALAKETPPERVGRQVWLPLRRPIVSPEHVRERLYDLADRAAGAGRSENAGKEVIVSGGDPVRPRAYPLKYGRGRGLARIHGTLIQPNNTSKGLNAM
jgi:hypothetical protein